MIQSMVVWLEVPCVDRSLFTAAAFEPGAKIMVQRSSTLGGGVPGNFAAASRLLGVTTVAVGLKTTSPLARIDYDDLIERGVQVHEVPGQYGSVEPIVCTIVVPEGHDRTILIEDPLITATDYDLLREGFVQRTDDAARRGPIGVYLGVLRQQAAKTFTMLRAAPRFTACTLESAEWPTEETASVIGNMDVIFVAEESFAAHRDQITGWQESHAFDLIVTLGKHGSRSILSDGHMENRYQAVPPTTGVVDTSGAGDCFAAAYCAQRWNGRTHDASMRFAAVLAGQHTANAGARVRHDLSANPAHAGQ